MRQIASLFAVFFLFAGTVMGEEDLLSRAKSQFEPIPKAPPEIEGNPADPVKVELGRKLYFDPRLSASHLISCNTCHNVGLAGADLQETSVGHGWQKGPRNAPTVYNSVYNFAQFWDGRAKDLAEQAKGPIQASVEMNSTPELVVKTLNSLPGYVELFREAFPDSEVKVSFENMAKSIEVYEATLITPGAPLDLFLQGNEKALNKEEKKGLELFMNKGCSACHGGINMGGSAYYPFGVVEAPDAEIRPPEDLGRFKVTNTSGDRYVFKSPSLRNVELTPPYFHSGKVWSLKDAVAIMGSAQLGIQLNSDERQAITAFLRTLTGDQPREDYPVLPPNTPETPRPRLAAPETGGEK